jgi:hypothetical protein
LGVPGSSFRNASGSKVSSFWVADLAMVLGLDHRDTSLAVKNIRPLVCGVPVHLAIVATG